MEIYNDIEGYEGFYKVSNKGNIQGLLRGNLLKLEMATSKNVHYLRASLSKEGIVNRFLVHRLVAAAFIQNPENKGFVNHIDNNPLNNAVDNLEWCTAKENMQHSAKQGRQLLVQKNCTQAAIAANYQRYINVWKAKLGSRFVAFYPAHQVLHKGEKPTAAVKYFCKACDAERLALTSWLELKAKGVCPNCALTISIMEEDIV